MTERTCWTLLDQAAAGDQAARDQFVQRYLPLVRECLRRRWSTRTIAQDVDDAIQEVFFECLRDDGVLERLQGNRVPQFRKFLFGVVRNIAKRAEAKAARAVDRPLETFHEDNVEAEEQRLSQIFDRVWLLDLLKEAAERHRQRALDQSGDSWQRFELLRLHFQQGLTVSEIARQWGIKANALHYTFGCALKDFEVALTETIRFHNPGAPEEVQREVQEIMRSL